MELNSSTLRGILAKITSVDPDFIVPKQGNWWNPQDQINKPDTWCAYRIRSNKPRTVPFYHETADNTNSVVVEKIATIELQFVGPQSEEIAQSIAAWPLRSDVKAQFETVNGALMYEDLESQASPFYQDGNNSVTAWNVVIHVLWWSALDTGQGRMPTLVLNGKINN